MKFFIMGANGFIGRHLVRYLLAKHHEVTALVRSDQKAHILPLGCRVVIGNPLKAEDWQKEAVKSDIIVNLVGRNIFSRWTNRVKEEIYISRIESTKQAVNCLNRTQNKATLINANAVGYYGIDTKEIVKETHPPGRDFLAKVCVDWQNVAISLANKDKRVVIARIAPVLGRDGGMFAKIFPFFKLGLGGKIGNGTQGFPWIHILDLVRAIEFVARKSNIDKAVNMVSPHMITNAQFTDFLGKMLSKPSFLKVPYLGLKLIFKDLAEVMTKGPKVFPEVLVKNGFVFKFSHVEKALKDLLWEDLKRQT